MRFRLPHLNGTKITSYILASISIFVLLATVSYTLNVKVLANWRLILPPGPIHAGDTILVQSVYTKLRAVDGRATRYIECKNDQGILIRYVLNAAPADHAPGVHTGTGIKFILPTNIPNLPTKCVISVNINYPIYPWHTTSQFNTTPMFELLPAVSKPAVNTTTSSTSQSPAPAAFRVESVPQLPSGVSSVAVTSSPDTAPIQPAAQQDTSQPAANPIQSPNIVTSLLNLLQPIL